MLNEINVDYIFILILSCQQSVRDKVVSCQPAELRDGFSLEPVRTPTSDRYRVSREQFNPREIFSLSSKY